MDKNFLSEIEIIKILRKHFPKIGDDTAEFHSSNCATQIVTIDSFTEKYHFDTKYFTPFNIGYKSMAASLSDIAASGGFPKYALVSLGLKKPDKEFIKGLYKGLNEVACHFNLEIIGGDTIRANCIIITICVIGEARKPIKRSSARIGNKIYVTGELGSSCVGLICLKNGIKSVLVKNHLAPFPRIKEGIEIAKYADSMIDISDGFSMDLFHILEESNVAAKIFRNKIPVNKESKKVADKLKLNYLTIALNGGEDFELLFTMEKKYVDKLKKKVKLTEVGEIIKSRVPKITDETGNKVPVGGYDHFKLTNYNSL